MKLENIIINKQVKEEFRNKFALINSLGRTYAVKLNITQPTWLIEKLPFIGTYEIGMSLNEEYEKEYLQPIVEQMIACEHIDDLMEHLTLSDKKKLRFAINKMKKLKQQ